MSSDISKPAIEIKSSFGLPKLMVKTLASAAIIGSLLVLSAISNQAHAQYVSDDMRTKLAPNFKLDKVVVLMRHGVRPQTNTKKLEENTGRQWPKWIVPDGFLTGHGYAGIVQQSHYMLDTWRAEGLPIANACPTSKDYFLWASPVQRTVATAQAVGDGMFPSCGVTPQHLELEKNDPLFQAVDLELAQPAPKIVEQQVLAAMGGSPEAAEKKYADDVARLRAAVCGDKSDDCKFLDEKWGFKSEKPGKYKLTGPVSAGSTIAETIRLQYSEGLPLENVAFGNVKNSDDVAKLMVLHAAKYDLVSNTKEIATHGGHVLMGQILNALAAGTADQKTNTYDRLNAPLVVFVGHDTNISQIQTIVDANWHLGNYPANDIPPGGMLIFKRYYDDVNKVYAINVSFTARSLDQWRNLTELNGDNAPLSQDFGNESCIKDKEQQLCRLDQFIERNNAQIQQFEHKIDLYK